MYGRMPPDFGACNEGGTDGKYQLKVDEYGFERSENFDYGTYEDFMSGYLSVLARRSKRWKELGDGKNKRSDKLKRFVRKGVPISERATVWMSTSGAKDVRANSAVTYVEMREKVGISVTTEMIEIDLPRTFPDNIFFAKDEALPRQLYNVLATFANQNVDVGYCQGLNYIGGLLLLATKDEETSFWLLKVLVEDILPQYYIKSMSGLITDLAVLDEMVRLREPAVHRQITKVGMPWAVATTKWFICLYSEVLPVETVFRIWDCLFYEGSKIIFRVALTLIRMHREEILACTDLAEMVTCFKDMARNPRVVNCHEFMTIIFKLPGKLSNSYVETLRKKHRHRS